METRGLLGKDLVWCFRFISSLKFALGKSNIYSSFCVFCPACWNHFFCESSQ